MTRIIVDELDLPVEERTFSGLLGELGPEYEVLIELREAEWVAPAWEHIKVYIQHPVPSATAICIVKKTTDLFFAWAAERLKKQQPANRPRKLTIYGPDRKPVKVVVLDHEGDK